jgi:ribosomal 50S subunit-recycling heat shock protein
LLTENGGGLLPSPFIFGLYKRSTPMRLDKYLKVSRIIKRRTVANEACDAGRVTVNGKVARASYDVKVGDVLTISMGQRPITLKVLTVVEHALKEDAKTMYEVVE